MFNFKAFKQLIQVQKVIQQTPSYGFWFNKSSSTGNTLYDKAGGKSVVEKSMKDFKLMLRANPELEHYFIWKDEKKYIPGSQAYAVNSLGGPYPYSGRNLRVSHRSLKITIECLEKAFIQNGVDQQTTKDIVKHFEEYRTEITNKYISTKKDEDTFEKYYNADWQKSVEKQEEDLKHQQNPNPQNINQTEQQTKKE